MKQPRTFIVFSSLLFTMSLVIFSVAGTPTVHRVSAQAAAKGTCTVKIPEDDNLILRKGPNVRYPVGPALFNGDQVTQMAVSEDLQWMQIAWQPESAGQSQLIFWIQISPDNLACTTAVTKLPVAPPPPTPSTPPTTIGPSRMASFEAGWAPFPSDLGEQRRFQANVIMPSEALISDTVIFPGHMGFELRFNPEQKVDDSLIESVATTFFKGLDDDEGDLIVYHHVAYQAPYCAFDHTTEHCESTWNFASTNYYWPKSDSEQIEPGDIPIDPASDYTVQMVMTLRDGTVGGEWDLHFKIQLRSAEVHRATIANIFDRWTEIDNSTFTNQNPHAILFVIQNGEPDNAGQIYNHPIGVWYNNQNNTQQWVWGIYNQDDATVMPFGIAFNVLMIRGADPSAFIHRTTSDNTANNWTEIDNSFTNGNPNALLLVTQNWKHRSDYNNHPVGVRYNRTTRKWTIFNQDKAAMPVGAQFNVLISPATPPTVFVHRATVANTANNETEIDNLLTNQNPNAILLVTPNWNPGGGSGQANPHAIGVKYNKQTEKWAIFNSDQGAMPVGAAFNVVVADNH